jgi:hypothetical protein
LGLISCFWSIVVDTLFFFTWTSNIGFFVLSFLFLLFLLFLLF